LRGAVLSLSKVPCSEVSIAEASGCLPSWLVAVTLMGAPLWTSMVGPA
jgi:hypothetical protein